jgi:hypothetical protein
MTTTVTNPQRTRITNNRKEIAKWRSHKPWKALLEAHCRVPEAVCVHCGRKHGETRTNAKGKVIVTVLTINHISRTRYWSEELYCTWDEADMEICCTLCNWKIESGQRPCPICKTTYIHWRQYSCQKCWDKEHPKEAEERTLGKWKKAMLWGLKKVLKKEADAVERKRWRLNNPSKVKRSTSKNANKSQDDAHSKPQSVLVERFL